MHFRLLVLLAAGPLAAFPLQAQDIQAPPVDSLVVEGNHRLTAAQILGTAGIIVHQSVNYRDVQRAITALFQTGQFDDVQVEQADADGLLVLVIRVVERPVLQKWTVRGVEKLSERTVKDRVSLVEGRPIDRSAVARSRAGIDSAYTEKGYYRAAVKSLELPQPDGSVRLVFDITEGTRVAISQITVEGNERYPDEELADHMKTKPEGFWWFQKGEYDESRLDQDLRENLPGWYGAKGLIDFQVLRDTLIADSTGGKATLALSVDEGKIHQVGTLNIVGNRRFSTEEIAQFYPFGGVLAVEATGPVTPRPFNQAAWEAATERLQTLYANNGYIYARIEPEQSRRLAPDGTPIVDLQWRIDEGQVATINRIMIVGNDVTHERVIRDAIVLLPGAVFNRDLLVRSYQNISNLGFFEQPLPPPDVQPTSNNVDVDITFRVTEKRTGNINFGASLGQGTGLGGFIGLEEPNLFGRGKRGKFQWQFGRNINDFTLSYTDPSIQASRISGTIALFNSRQRYVVGDLGRRRQLGGSLQFGFPFLGARYTRLFTSYGYQRISYEGGSEDLRESYSCESCVRSSLGFSVVRDTRVGLPFATGGHQVNTSLEFNGGPLGGDGDYRKFDVEGHWYAPLGTLGGGAEQQLGGGVQFVLGLTTKTGFIFGDAGPFFTELYAMGGVQYGLPLRGYEEFSITPDGYDPAASGGTASPDAFGQSYASFTVEFGARMSQSLYVNTFFDAGNVYRTTDQFDPTRLFRGAGFGVALVSPLGPIGIDLAYGFDKIDFLGRPDPGWKFHFKLGNFF